MARHGYDNPWSSSSQGRRDGGGPGMIDDPTTYDTVPRRPRRLRMAVVLVGLALWSLLALVGYALVDPMLGWIASNAGLLVDGGKGLATATGAGKEVGNIVDGLNVSGFLGQVIALLRIILKPTIVVVWAIGALVLIAAPAIMQKIGRLLVRH